MRARSLCLTAAAALGVASTASAGLVVGPTHVDHRVQIQTHYTGTNPITDPGTVGPIDTTTTTLDSAAPDGVFSTYDGKTGVTANLSDAGGTFRVDTDYFLGSFPDSGPSS